MKNLNVTEETVYRFADAAKTIIVAKSRLSNELTRFILDHRSMIEATVSEQNHCAVKRLERAFKWLELSQSNFNNGIVYKLRWIPVYNNADSDDSLDVQIEDIDYTFRNILGTYAPAIYWSRVLIGNHMISKFFKEKIKKSPEWRRRLDGLYSEINQAALGLVDLSSKNRFSIENLERSVNLCLRTEELDILTSGNDKYLAISQAKKMTFTDLLLQYLSRFA